MNISEMSGVSAVLAAAQSPGADEQQILVLKKAMDMQASSAATLLQSLPQSQPTLATMGSLGVYLNTFA